VLDPVGASRLVLGNYPTPPPSGDGGLRVYPMVLYPGVSTPDLATVIDLRLGEDRSGLDLSLRPVPAVPVEGTVFGPEQALKGLVLRLIPAGLEGLANGAEVATTMVRADRRFTFVGVPAGEYVIDAPGTTLELTYEGAIPGATLPQPPGIRWGSFNTSSIDSGSAGTSYKRSSGSRSDDFWARTEVSVGAAGVSDLAVTLAPSIPLEGRLVYEGTTRTTVESVPTVTFGAASSSTSIASTTTTPRPTSQPTIAAEPANGNPSLGLPRSNRPTEADPLDVFHIDGLKPGEYVLRVGSGLARYAVKSITLDGVDITNKPLDASAIGPRSEVVMTLTDKMIVLSGNVHDDRGMAAGGAVLVFPVERDQWSRYGLTPLRIRAVPLAGTSEFSVSALPAGDYFVVAVEASQLSAWQNPGFLSRAAAVATRVTLQWGDARTLALTRVVVR
jgi:hypothetical protein